MTQRGEIPRRLLASGRSSLATVLERAIAENSSGRVLLAVSGGTHSLPLLWLGAALAQRRPEWSVAIGHVNHGLRETASAEAEFVRADATASGLDCIVEEVDCSGPGNRAAIARVRREEAFARMAEETGSEAVVTAHHADDQFETVIAAIARGAGPRGWQGMARRRRLGQKGLLLLRPFLATPGAALEALGGRLRLHPVEDPSNRDPRRLRGRLRQGVCRELETIFPGASRRVAAAAEQAAVAELAIDRWLDEVWGPPEVRSWSRELLRDLPATLVAAGLRRTTISLRPDLADRLAEARCREVAEAVGDRTRSPRRWAWPGGVVVTLTARTLSLDPRS